MAYTEIVKKLNSQEFVGELNLEELLKEFFEEISSFNVTGVEIIGKDEDYYKAIIESRFFWVGRNPSRDKTEIKFNDVTFFAKKLGRERYDGAWRKKLYENLNSSIDKKELENSIQKYADDLEQDIFSK